MECEHNLDKTTLRHLIIQLSGILTCIQGVSRLEDITAAGDLVGLCDQTTSYKNVSDFGRLRNSDRLKLGREGNDC
jgi:hypothetical protein